MLCIYCVSDHLGDRNPTRRQGTMCIFIDFWEQYLGKSVQGRTLSKGSLRERQINN